MAKSELIPSILIEKEITNFRELGVNVTGFKTGFSKCPKCGELIAVWRYRYGDDEFISCKIEIAGNEKQIERFNVFNKTHNRFEGPWLTKDEFDEQYDSDAGIFDESPEK